MTKSDFVSSRESIRAPKKIRLELLKLKATKKKALVSTNDDAKKIELNKNSSSNSFSRISSISQEDNSVLLINLKNENDLAKSEFMQPLK